MKPRVPPTRDEIHMQTAELWAQMSKDPGTQVGAVLIGGDKRVLSVGYNGAPNGFPDEFVPWIRSADRPEDTKYPWVIHAELNAILNFKGLTSDLRGSTLYTTHFPCSECTKALIQVGVKRVVYKSDVTGMDLISEVTYRLAEHCGFEIEGYIENTD
jgi:dCMP deaminase